MRNESQEDGDSNLIASERGCSITRKLEKKFRTAQRAMEREMVGVTLRQERGEVRIREQTNVTHILVQINRKKCVM